MNEPSANGDGILLLYSQYTHDGCLLYVLVNNLLNHVIPYSSKKGAFGVVNSRAAG